MKTPKNTVGRTGVSRVKEEVSVLEARRETIIIVDDDTINLIVARNTLSEKYDVFTAPSGEKLLSLLEKAMPDLILLDIEMPEMNGYEVIQQLKSTEKTMHIPVIFLTAKIDPINEVKGLTMGAVDYITKPYSRELLMKRIDLHILFEKQKKELLKYNLSLESEVDKKTKTVMQLQNAILKTVAELVECRDNVTGGHIERTQHYLSLLLDFLAEHEDFKEEISNWDVNLLVMSSQLHDVGKISIKDNILMKPGRLTLEECEEMKKHTLYGVEIIRRIEESTTESDFLAYAETLAGYHHEKWDGAGYPYGVKEDAIPLQGRVLAIIDVYDALTNDRPYKKAFPHEDAVRIIAEGSGTQFDPRICKVFLTHEKSFKDIDPDIYSFDGKKNGLQPTIRVVTNALSSRSGKNDGHAERIQDYLEILSEALLSNENYSDEVSAWDTSLFLLSAQVHDVGKIAVSDHILHKPEELSEKEYEDVKSHVEFGVKVIKQVKEHAEYDSLLQHAEASAEAHHEKWDGTGYPYGLKGEDIPLQGRIMAIVDVYEALTTDRPHRQRKTHREAVDIIRNGAGTHFDPELVSVFIDCEKEFEATAAKQ